MKNNINSLSDLQAEKARLLSLAKVQEEQMAQSLQYIQQHLVEIALNSLFHPKPKNEDAQENTGDLWHLLFRELLPQISHQLKAGGTWLGILETLFRIFIPKFFK